jgi:hypothetical protein
MVVDTTMDGLAWGRKGLAWARKQVEQADTCTGGSRGVRTTPLDPKSGASPRFRHSRGTSAAGQSIWATFNAEEIPPEALRPHTLSAKSRHRSIATPLALRDHVITSS